MGIFDIKTDKDYKRLTDYEKKIIENKRKLLMNSKINSFEQLKNSCTGFVDVVMNNDGVSDTSQAKKFNLVKDAWEVRGAKDADSILKHFGNFVDNLVKLNAFVYTTVGSITYGVKGEILENTERFEYFNKEDAEELKEGMQAFADELK